MIKQLPGNHTAINEKAEGVPNSYINKSVVNERHLVKSLAGSRKEKQQKNK